MCLAIYKPTKAKPDWDALEEGFKCNSHGAGFAVAHSGSLEIHKGFFTFDDFASAFERHAHKQALVHFRWATHGNRDAEMCHPFLITEELALIHNGVLPISTADDRTKSDTWHYVEYVLKPLAERDRGFYSDSSIKFLGEAAISGSKFIFLRADGDFDIWNSDDGHWSGDCWYSNRSYAKSQSIGFQRWPKEEQIILSDERTPTDDADQSLLYEDLTTSQQWDYEDALEAGYTAAEIDEHIVTNGVESLKYLVRWRAYEEEQI